MITIYIAGPLFSLAEREFNQRLSDLISKGMDGATVILPQTETKRLLKESDPCAHIFDFCVRAIDGADVMIAILDGPDVDSGTSFEIGYAFSRNKPIIGVRTDPRQLEDKGVNLMISRSMYAMVGMEQDDMTMEALAAKIVRILRSEDLVARTKGSPDH